MFIFFCLWVVATDTTWLTKSNISYLALYRKRWLSSKVDQWFSIISMHQNHLQIFFNVTSPDLFPEILTHLTWGWNGIQVLFRRWFRWINAQTGWRPLLQKETAHGLWTGWKEFAPQSHLPTAECLWVAYVTCVYVTCVSQLPYL